MPDIRVKICGLRSLGDVAAVAATKAAYAGFVFFPKSPRHLTIPQARALTLAAPVGLAKVALLVDADDALLDAITEAMPLDMLQLHGRESIDRITAVKARTGRPVWRANGVATRADIREAIAGAGPADRLLLDAKAPREATLPGGNGAAFDWRLLDGMHLPLPWGLSGGLDAGNVGAALALLRPDFVDVSSGIEDQPGVKSVIKIKAFAEAVRAA